MGQKSGAMKVTTVRFGADLWALLEAEAGLSGVSISQYIREAALARAAAAAALRGEDPLVLLAGGTGPADAHGATSEQTAWRRTSAADTREQVAEVQAELSATRAQASQAIRRSRQLAAQSEALRGRLASANDRS